jgi:hypothetical protein
MPDYDVATVIDLSDEELEMVAAGGLTLNLSNLVNLKIAVANQNGQNISVLSSGAQSILQGIGQIQIG